MCRFLQRFHLRIGQRARLRIMAFVTIADTGIISYVSTRNLAERWGFGPLSWLYPLCLDAVAAVGMDLWMSNSPAKRPAAWLSLFAVGLSLAANVADWLYVGPGAAVLGAVPPLMLAALLLTMHYHAARTEQPNQTRSPATSSSTDQPHGMVDAAATPNPDRGRQRVPRSRPTRKGPRPPVSDEEVIAAIRQRRQHGPVSRRGLMAEFGLGTPRATRLLAEATNGTQPGLTSIPDDGNA
jgi:hypothetical protein